MASRNSTTIQCQLVLIDDKHYGAILKKEATRLFELGCAWVPFYESRKATKNVLESFALFFKREFEYDFLQYSSFSESEDKDFPFLFFSHDYDDRELAVGGGKFIWREWSNAPPSWALQWIWLHPYYRKRGIFKRVCPEFKKMFGDFFIEPPLSGPMQFFVKKYHHEIQEGFYQKAEAITKNNAVSYPMKHEAQDAESIL